MKIYIFVVLFLLFVLNLTFIVCKFNFEHILQNGKENRKEQLYHHLMFMFHLHQQQHVDLTISSSSESSFTRSRKIIAIFSLQYFKCFLHIFAPVSVLININDHIFIPKDIGLLISLI